MYKVVINGKEYPEGQGKSAKEAKQHAAQRAWSEINEHSGWTTQAGRFRNTDIFINLDVHDVMFINAHACYESTEFWK